MDMLQTDWISTFGRETGTQVLLQTQALPGNGSSTRPPHPFLFAPCKKCDYFESSMKSELQATEAAPKDESSHVTGEIIWDPLGPAITFNIMQKKRI